MDGDGGRVQPALVQAAAEHLCTHEETADGARAREGAGRVHAGGVRVAVVLGVGLVALVDVGLAVVADPRAEAGRAERALALVAVLDALEVDARGAVAAHAAEAVIDVRAGLDEVRVQQRVRAGDPLRVVVLEHAVLDVAVALPAGVAHARVGADRKSTRLNSSH